MGGWFGLELFANLSVIKQAWPLTTGPKTILRWSQMQMQQPGNTGGQAAPHRVHYRKLRNAVGESPKTEVKTREK
jgi:hypothetical protein